jgi:hypothetical protein
MRTSEPPIVVLSMAECSNQSHALSSPKSDSVPDLLIRGADMLDRVHRVCEGIERRAEAVIKRSVGRTHEGPVSKEDA